MGVWRIPGNTTRVSDNWTDHRARGSLGGTDFTDPAGTTMHAMHAGTVTIVDNSYGGSGGAYVRVTADNGESTEQLHATRITAYRGQRVAMGDPIGISGGSGFGSVNYYGAHIHAHAVSSRGVRYSVEPNVFGGGTIPAGGNNSTPVTNQSEEDIMAELSPETKKFITDTVRDQVNSLLNEDKPGRPSVRATIVSQVNQSLGTITKAIVTDLKNVITRERWQLAKVKGRDTIWAINMATGAFDAFANPAELLDDMRHEKVSSYDLNGTRVPEPPMEFDNLAALNAFIDGLKVVPGAKAV